MFFYKYLSSIVKLIDNFSKYRYENQSNKVQLTLKQISELPPPLKKKKKKKKKE